MRPGDMLILVIILAGFLIYNINSYLRKRRLSQGLTAARKAVRDAVEVLTEQGHRIIDVQRSQPFTTVIDDKHYHHTVNADLITKKDGKTYLVEVRSRKQNSRLTSARSRRQLLEYFVLYRPDGIILLDLDSGRMRTVLFQLPGPGKTLRRLLQALAYAAVGMLGAWVSLRFWS